MRQKRDGKKRKVDRKWWKEKLGQRWEKRKVDKNCWKEKEKRGREK